MRPILLALLLVLLPRPLWAEAAPTAPFVAGEVIVGWRPGARRPPLTHLAGRLVLSARPLSRTAWLYTLEETSRRATLEALAALRGHPELAYAEPNYYRRPFATPNDPHFPYQWNLTVANLPKAWETTKGSKSVVVAVLDTGVLSAHPDLKGRLAVGRDFISTPSEAGDGDGWDGDPKDMGTEKKDSSAFHGTHVAGIIGAASNNKVGMSGVDWRCLVQPVRVLGINRGLGRDTDIAAGLRWAAGLPVSGVSQNPTPARVINLSFGGPGASTTLSQAVKDALAKGVLVVAAVGNDGVSGDNIYPAAVPGVLGVGAVQLDLSRAPYSNFGEVVDIMAPGGNMTQFLPAKLKCGNQLCPAGLLGTLYDTGSKSFGYRFYDGTSQAAPMVSGVVALMLAARPGLNTTQLTTILRQTARAKGTCPQGCGAGLLDAGAAVGRAAQTTPQSPGKLPFSAACQSDVQCQGGLCRDVDGAGKRCTRTCGSGSPCPTGSACQAGLCTPTFDPGSGSSTGNDCFGLNFCSAPPGVVEGHGIGGCALAPAGQPTPLVLVASLLLALALTRRRRR